MCLSWGRSPRTRTDRELIGFGRESFVLQGEIHSRDRDFLSRIEAAAGRKKKITVNRVPVKNASELSQVLGTVFFRPEDLLLIREGAAAPGSTSTRPEFSGTARSGRTCWTPCRSSTGAWRRPGRC